MADKTNLGDVSRRSILAGAALIPVTALTAPAQSSTATKAAAKSVFSPLQLRTLEAFLHGLVPKDENGPGAVECGAAIYIDRCLADYLAPEKSAFLAGLASTEALARKTYDASFADLPPDKRDQLLTTMETGTAAEFSNARAFFARVRRLTLEGMFSDPFYGGNRNFAGWDLIRYPGPRLAAGPDDQKMSAPSKPIRTSVYGSSAR